MTGEWWGGRRKWERRRLRIGNRMSRVEAERHRDPPSGRGGACGGRRRDCRAAGTVANRKGNASRAGRARACSGQDAGTAGRWGGAPSPPPPAPPLFAGSGPRGPRLSPHPWIPQRGGARRLARPHIPLRQLRGTYQPRGRPQRGPGLRDPGRSDGGPGAMFPWRLVPEAAVAAAAAPAAGGRADPPSRAPSSASSTSSSSRRAAALPRGGGRGGEGGGAGTRGRADQPRSLPPPSRAMAAAAAAAAAAALRHLLPAAAAAVRAPKTLSLVRVRV